MRGYEALADALVQEGIDTVFVVLADDNIRLMLEMTGNRGIKMISARNERGAAGMADGYYRATGKPGVCVVTGGPGLSNAATTLTTASRNRSQVLCITTAAPPAAERYSAKASDPRPIAEATGGKFLRVRRPETLAEDIQFAFRHIRSCIGPAVLAVPQDILGGELDMVWEYTLAAARMPASPVTQPDSETVNRAAALLAEAERPVILAGRGAVASGAEAEIRALAERTGALVATTLKATGYLADHPYCVGVSGSAGPDIARSLLPESDCVVAVGASLNVLTTQLGFLFPAAQFIHIDRDPGRIGETTPVALGIIGDARATLAAINARLGERNAAGKRGFWNPEVKSRIADSRSQQAPAYIIAPDIMDPREVVAEMDRLLPENRLVFTDGGHFVFFVISGMPATLVNTTLEFGSVGMGLSQAIGAAVGRPDRHVVAFIGDGGLMMSLEELDTAARYRLPMTIVIMNDNAYGAEVRFLEAWGKPTDMVFFKDREFATVAKGLGAVGFTARNVEDLRRAAAAIGKGDGPVLIDVKINVGVVHEAMSPESLSHRQ